MIKHGTTETASTRERIHVMQKHPARPPAVSALAAAVVFLACASAVAQHAGGGTRTGPTPWLFGESYCAPCHAHPESYRSEQVVCRMNEAQTWEKSDKHKNAFALLSGPRGLHMGKVLKIDVTTNAACLNCHSAPLAPAAPRPGGERLAVRTQQFDRTRDGVTCVVCHGAFREWVLDHTAFEDPEWRGLSRAEKERRAGMVDLWDPATRTRKCLSCHLGNLDEDKILTHAMYAAGHPPLPGIEVSSFCEAMPNHWEWLRDKQAGRRPEVVQTLKQTLDLNKLEQTELVAVGGLLTLREALRLLAAQVSADRPDVPGMRWPDFARFDCYACHHDVNRPNWRQDRLFPGAPGRPPAPTWPMALVILGLEAAGPDQAAQRREEYQRGLRALHEALAAEPFGDRPRTIAAAQGLADWTDETVKALAKTRIDRPLALKLLRTLCRLDRDDLPDYDTARQLFWALRTIARELEPDPKARAPIDAVLARMDNRLGFSLPSAGLQVPIEETLEIRLKAVARFDPAPFLELVGELTRALPSR